MSDQSAEFYGYTFEDTASGQGKGKASEIMQQAVEELEYLVTFNRSMSQAMECTMQDLSEGIS